MNRRDCLAVTSLLTSIVMPADPSQAQPGTQTAPKDFGLDQIDGPWPNSDYPGIRSFRLSGTGQLNDPQNGGEPVVDLTDTIVTFDRPAGTVQVQMRITARHGWHTHMAPNPINGFDIIPMTSAGGLLGKITFMGFYIDGSDSGRLFTTEAKPWRDISANFRNIQSCRMKFYKIWMAK